MTSVTFNIPTKVFISTLNLSQLSLRIVGLSLVIICLLSACAKEKYQAKPIEAAQVTAKLINKDINDAGFKAYLIKQGYQESKLPFSSWGLTELTLCALYYHSKLDVVKAQLALAVTNLETAGLKNSVVLSGNLARSNQANGDIRPWAYGLNVEVPLETANKRKIRIEEAQHLVEVARIDVADTAWQLRNQIAKDLLRYHENFAQTQALSEELKQKDALVKIIEKRMQHGELSSNEFHAVKLQYQKTLFSLNTEQVKSSEIIAALASDVGLTQEKFSQLVVKSVDVDTSLKQQASYFKLSSKSKLLESALLNRLDIRRSLEKYAAAEAKIKLEVAKQTPDISLTPGFAFEFGDKVWSLGFSTLLNLLNKHPTLIQEATRLREIEGAQFEALQASIIGELDQNLAKYEASAQQLNKLKEQQVAQSAFDKKIQKQFDAGLIDKLELTQHQLNLSLLEQQLVVAQFNLLNTGLSIENMMQRPLFDDSLSISTISENSSTEILGTSP